MIDEKRCPQFLASIQKLCEEFGLALCINCRKVYSKNTIKSRLLCQTCYRDDDTRADYPMQRRGGWHATARVWDVLEKALFLDMIAKGMTNRQIAKQLGRPEGSIRRARERFKH